MKKKGIKTARLRERPFCHAPLRTNGHQFYVPLKGASSEPTCGKATRIPHQKMKVAYSGGEW
jgi:hypothetical protein